MDFYGIDRRQPRPGVLTEPDDRARLDENVEGRLCVRIDSIHNQGTTLTLKTSILTP